MNPNNSLMTLLPSDSLLTEFDMKRAVGFPIHSFSSHLSFEDVLNEFGPLPREALFMGQAYDGLPVLFDLHDPLSGPLLIVGKFGSGKTELIRMLAEYIVSTHSPSETQFAVVTNRTDEWQGRLADAPDCIGVFSSQSEEASRLIQSLSLWLSADRGRSQSIILFLDGFHEVQSWGEPTIHCLRQILANGPEKLVWPIATISLEYEFRINRWQSFFRTKIFAKGFCEPGFKIYQTENSITGFRAWRRPWFSMKEKGKWLDFWVPSLGY